MTFILFLIGCSSDDINIKEDTKMRLWFAQNTVMLFEPCFADLQLTPDSKQEEIDAAISKQKKLCDKFHEKRVQLFNMCQTEIPTSFSDPRAPNNDTEYLQKKEELQRICAVVLETTNPQKPSE